MRRIRVLGLALMAVFALSAVAVSAASAAEPEVLPAGGKFPVKYTSTSGKGKLESSSGLAIECTSDTNTGSFTGAKTGEVTVDFKGCTSAGGKCQTAGASEKGLIETVLLATTLVFTSTSPLEVGILLKPKTGTFFTPVITCETILGNITTEVEGSLVGIVTPINTKTSKFTLSFKQEKGTQKPNEYINEKGEKVSALLESSFNKGAFELAGEETTDEVTAAEEVTIDG